MQLKAVADYARNLVKGDNAAKEAVASTVANQTSDQENKHVNQTQDKALKGFNFLE